jgi:hypothetical protein
MSHLLKLLTPLGTNGFVAIFATRRIAHATTLWFAVSLFFAPAFAQGLDGSQETPTYRALHPPVSTDTATVSIQFGPSRYKIPRNYLAGATQARVDTYAAFTIQVLLPDLTPRTSENERQFDVVGWHNKLRALFEYGRNPRAPEAIRDFYLTNAGMTKDDYRLVGSGYKLYENAKISPREIYTKETTNGLLFILCGTKKDGTPFPSCTVNEAIEENVGVIYHFSRDHLDRASEIDRELRALLRSFKENDR